jgi:HSP20 family protein
MNLEKMQEWLDLAERSGERPFWHDIGEPSTEAEKNESVKKAEDAPPFPRIDVYQNDTEHVITIEVPGANRQDIELTLTGAALTVKGTIRQVDRDVLLVQGERYHGPFERSITVPFYTHGNPLSAKLDKGLLQIRYPVSLPVQRNILVE